MLEDEEPDAGRQGDNQKPALPALAASRLDQIKIAPCNYFRAPDPPTGGGQKNNQNIAGYFGLLVALLLP